MNAELKNLVVKKIPDSKDLFEQNLSDIDIISGIAKLPNVKENFQILAVLGVFTEKIDRFNIKKCAYCCLKHLTSLKGTMLEFTKYNTSIERENLMMDLICAELHLRGVNDALSLEINALRIDIFETENSLLPKHLEWREKLYAKVENLTKVKDFKVQIKAEDFDKKIDTVKKPCGCGNKKENKI